jgi:hypothetical protein
MNRLKQHYHHVCGLVMFQTPGGNAMGTATVNTVLRSDSQNVPARQIGRAQQAMQMSFHEQAQDPSIQVVGLPIISISYLGFMTEKEFNAPPEGMALKEVGGPKLN